MIFLRAAEHQRNAGFNGSACEGTGIVHQLIIINILCEFDGSDLMVDQ